MAFPPIPSSNIPAPNGDDNGSRGGGYGYPSGPPTCYESYFGAGAFYCVLPKSDTKDDLPPPRTLGSGGARAAIPQAPEAPKPEEKPFAKVFMKVTCYCFCNYDPPESVTNELINFDPGCDPPGGTGGLPPAPGTIAMAAMFGMDPITKHKQETRRFVMSKTIARGPCHNMSKCTKKGVVYIVFKIRLFAEGDKLKETVPTGNTPSVEADLKECGIKYDKERSGRRLSGMMEAMGHGGFDTDENTTEFTADEPLTAEQAACLNAKICGCGDDFNIALAKARIGGGSPREPGAFAQMKKACFKKHGICKGE